MTKKVGDDEENTPLLRDSVNRFRGDGAENAYGSCNSRSNSIAEPHVSKLDPELNKEGEEEMKPRELNLWDFMKNLRVC